MPNINLNNFCPNILYFVILVFLLCKLHRIFRAASNVSIYQIKYSSLLNNQNWTATRQGAYISTLYQFINFQQLKHWFTTTTGPCPQMLNSLAYLKEKITDLMDLSRERVFMILVSLYWGGLIIPNHSASDTGGICKQASQWMCKIIPEIGCECILL